MATIRVSNNSELASAVRTAGAGDTISLSGGTYSLSVSGENFSGATISAATGAKVTFSHMTLKNVQNLNIEDVDFSGAGSRLFDAQNSSNITVRNADFRGSGDGVGFYVKSNDDISLENSTIHGFKTGVFIKGIDGLTVRSNSISDISLDGMQLSGVQDGTISGNSISMDVKAGTKHSDGIQFFGGNMTNITIQNNLIETHNTISHGIYGGNGSSSFYKNLTIDHNTVVSAQMSGIAVGETNGLKITNNIVLHDPSERSGTPDIRVNHDATGVTISGNVTHKTPVASGTNWAPTNKSEPGWTISNNKLVSVGTSLKAAESLAPNAGAPDSVKSAGAASAASVASMSAAETLSAAPAAATADAHADTFRFDGHKGTGGHVDGLDFGAGDRLVLRHFNSGTFEALSGGNPLHVSAAGTLAKIDSLADLRELDRTSSKVSLHIDGDTLVLDIAQKGADHVIELAGLGHAYADLL